MSTNPISILSQLFDQINAVHFSGKLTDINLEWGIPKLLEISTSNHFDNFCSMASQQIIVKGKDFYLSDTANALIYAAHCQNEKAKQIISKAMDHLRTDSPDIYQQLISQYNKIGLTFSYAKPEDIRREDDGRWKIIIHEQLEKNRTPLYVIKYLIHHACLHYVFKIETTTDYPLELIELDRFIPDRKRALVWLRNAKYFSLFD